MECTGGAPHAVTFAGLEKLEMIKGNKPCKERVIFWDDLDEEIDNVITFQRIEEP